MISFNRVPVESRATFMLDLVRKEWPILTVYFGLVVGLTVVTFIDFRTGAIVLALSVLWALILRWLLSDVHAGMLKVRRRRVDLVVLSVLGALLLVLALVVPHQ